MSSSRKIDIVQLSFEHGLKVGWQAIDCGRLGLRAVRLLKRGGCIKPDFHTAQVIPAVETRRRFFTVFGRIARKTR